MCPSQLFFIVSLLLLLFIINSSRANNNTSSAYCPSSVCNNGLNISYPFWRLDSYYNSASHQYCGYPGFGIYCSQTDSILNISDELFNVTNINYSSYSLTLVDIDAVDNRGCPRAHQNLSLGHLPLKYSEVDLYLGFYYNCTRSPSYVARQFDCINPGGNKSYYVEDHETEDLDWFEICEKKVVVPVTEGWLTRGLGAVMGEGFLLHWENVSDCAQCEATDGRCGYDNSIQEYLCFFKDGNTKGLAAAGTAIAVACGLMCCFRFRKTNKTSKREDHNVEAFQRQFGSLASTTYSYSDIKKMTNSFKEKLGEGGYGGVYKGNLNGHPVAVKILKETKGNGEEFINEVASISRTSHVNIVTLLGFCLNRKEKALVYEFMPNGSLDKHIYNEDSNMGWEMLYKIALGIARGLQYLHRGCNTRILHFDTKPHNILLDEDFCPKISDFGLARLCNRKESIMSTIEARGTIGYIAPEVFSRNFGGVSHKSDVYSYGMMILEMVGGRKNYSAERSHNSEIYFPRWAYQRILLDDDLNIRDMMTNEEEEIAKKMILVGLWCIQTDPLQRPAIGKVIEMLEGSLEAMQMPPKPFICSPSQSEGSTLERPRKPLLFSTLSSTTLESTASTIVQFDEE
ncbi:LEAF RUST 10 DISEASE-RESISTANCE LOCUS RECEPTOR-LIKE PROTEIN KINASE-like 2.1 isoform X2 [Solanum dulcamara]|uniref:LEAF RUST 10 DISEASE-RESISTANCE LOCUS RECEPTOR-LIKE PROTEIN KINASE-like 2.1 isoform X2 n=1 Tax=Solanum dulcamara TaxID=45834 RepID=UPI002485330B|nr:LEAF RUST 10 DISEASE-RESISTANCE LOCUS RECEPTOR-LIKE PROTEIN KINASE-like 2.1 isoform X2 [Solanum dulcamara]